MAVTGTILFRSSSKSPCPSHFQGTSGSIFSPEGSTSSRTLQKESKRSVTINLGKAPHRGPAFRPLLAHDGARGEVCGGGLCRRRPADEPFYPQVGARRPEEDPQGILRTVAGYGHPHVAALVSLYETGHVLIFLPPVISLLKQ